MKFEIVDNTTQKTIDSCKSESWLEAVQFVEQNKKTYLDQSVTEVKLIELSGETCIWPLTSEVRPLLLKDKNFSSPEEDKKKRKKKKE